MLLSLSLALSLYTLDAALSTGCTCSTAYISDQYHPTIYVIGSGGDCAMYPEFMIETGDGI